jgi:hypothetical protein
MSLENLQTNGTEMPDMLIVSAREASFLKHFIEEKSWYPVRIDSRRIDALKWIAVYQSRPISAITHLAKIVSIRQYSYSREYQVDFEEPEKLASPIRPDPEDKLIFQGQRYSWKRKIGAAMFMSDLKPWG